MWHGHISVFLCLVINLFAARMTATMAAYAAPRKRGERNFNQPTEKSVSARRVSEIYYIWLDHAKSRGR